MLAEEHVLLQPLDGACWPAGPGGAVDAAYALACSALHDRAVELADAAAARSEGWRRRCLDVLRHLCADLPTPTAIEAFRPAVAFAQLHPRTVEADPLSAALGLARLVVGGPHHVPLTLVLPEFAFPQGRLYFPHLDLILHAAGGPVVVSADAAQVRFIWVDGLSATVPASAIDLDGDLHHPRLERVARVRGMALLNGCPEIRAPTLDVSPAPELSIGGDALAALTDGVALIEAVWPAAATAMHRSFNAVVIQPTQRDHVTSLSTDQLQGALITSCRDPVQVAEAICHEGSHTRLALFLRLDLLIEDDGAHVHSSPWRRDPRPLSGLLNGIHAFVNVCGFYRRLAERRPEHGDAASRVFDLQRGKVREAWATLAPHLRPTRLGAPFVEELERAVAAL